MTASDTAVDRQAHWQQVYTSKDEQAVSWFEAVPAVSLDLVIDALLDKGYRDVTVLDLSAEALAKSKARLGKRGATVRWLEADVTTWQPERLYDLWPDGPNRCSGLPVVRHDPASLAALLGPSFELTESRRHDHHTPAAAVQHFQFSRFRRTA